MAENPHRLAQALAVLPSLGQATARSIETGVRPAEAGEENRLRRRPPVQATMARAKRFPAANPGWRIRHVTARKAAVKPAPACWWDSWPDFEPVEET